MKVLHVSSEYYGLAKTGGLADVCEALPTALADLGVDTRVCLPAYSGTLEQLLGAETVTDLTVRGEPFRIVSGRLPHSNHEIYLLDSPRLFQRPGDPYRDEYGVEHADNGWRFGCFCEAVCRLVVDNPQWTPDVVHLHDWQTGLIAGWLRHHDSRVKTLFTIHNLAYQGIFGEELFRALGLPRSWWVPGAVQQFDAFSFMKAGINFSHAVTTVSPSYAREICTVEHGFGLDGYLRQRSGSLYGILNGINVTNWNPATDRHLDTRYSIADVAPGKAANQARLRKQLGLVNNGTPLIIFIGRFAAQKGVDLLYEARYRLSRTPVQFTLLGSGDFDLQTRCLEWAEEFPQQVRTIVGIDEAMAHRLTAAADFQIIPSRFEPCGLSQMYAQNYGTIPIVRKTGGLQDTVIDASTTALQHGSATGIQFEDADTGGILYGIDQAVRIASTNARSALQINGMRADFSWRTSAARYQELYHSI